MPDILASQPTRRERPDRLRDIVGGSALGSLLAFGAIWLGALIGKALA